MPTPTKFTFRPETSQEALAQRVYWKERWADDWTLMPNLWCNEAVWNIAPTLPTAQLSWRYGVALPPGAAQWQARLRERNRLRMLVMVEYDVEPIHTFVGEAIPQEQGPLRWFGSTEIELDDVQGLLWRSIAGSDRDPRPIGENHFLCHGLEGLLDLAEVTTAVVRDPNLFSGGTFEVLRGLTFNRGGEPNLNLQAGDEHPLAFHYARHDPAEPQLFWSTARCVEYLLQNNTPVDGDGNVRIEFRVYDIDNLLPQWDRPELPTDGRTVRELLDALLPRQRLLSWRLVPLEALDNPVTRGTKGQPILLIPVSLARDDVTLDSSLSVNPLANATFRANPKQLALACEQDRSTRARVKRSSADACDRVTVRGAQRTSTATFFNGDFSLDAGWPAALQTERDDGASHAADYPAADEVELRQWRNRLAREDDKFAAVYARFVLFDEYGVNWSYRVTSGISGGTPYLVTFDEDDANGPTAAAKPVKLAPEDFGWLPALPLLSGFDLSGGALAGGYENLVETAAEALHEPLPPLVLFPRRDDEPSGTRRFRPVESAGSLADLERVGEEERETWSARVRVSRLDGALWVVVANGPQHAIAASSFQPLAGVDSAGEAVADWKEMVCTLALAWTDRVEVSWPPTVSALADHVREMIVDLGDLARCDYVVPQTIVALDPETGEPVRSEGGFFRDDRDRMLALAHLAFAWYGTPRRSLELTTARINSALELGMFVQSVGDTTLAGSEHVDEVNGVISQRRIASPLAFGEGGGEPAVPSLSYQTTHGELDLVSLFPGQRP